MSVLARTRRLNGCVESEQIRLPRDTGNDLDDIADLFGTFSKLCYHIRRGDDRIGNGIHLIDRRHDETIPFLRFLRGVFDVGGDTLDGRRCGYKPAIERAHLMLRLCNGVELRLCRLRSRCDGLRDTLCRLSRLSRTAREDIGRLGNGCSRPLNGLRHRADVLKHLVAFIRHLCELIPRVCRHTNAKIPLRHSAQ